MGDDTALLRRYAEEGADDAFAEVVRRNADEIAGGDTYTLGPDGWGLRPLSLRNADVLAAIHQRIDPVTGDFIPPGALTVSKP